MHQNLPDQRALTYPKAAEKRGPGFAIQALAGMALWAGALGAVVLRLAH